MELVPIGYIRRKDDEILIELDDELKPALLGIEGFSHIVVCYWLHENDNPEGRGVLQVHPRADEKNPLTGVFATHSPMRPNPLAITVCKLLSVDGTTLKIEDIDAFDGSPVVDIKCYIPAAMPEGPVELPEWV